MDIGGIGAKSICGCGLEDEEDDDDEGAPFPFCLEDKEEGAPPEEEEGVLKEVDEDSFDFFVSISICAMGRPYGGYAAP